MVTEAVRGFAAVTYDQLERLLDGVPPRLVYNFDEYRFQPGQGRARKVFRLKSCPDLTEGEKGENITIVKCISADGWLIAPFFMFKASGANHMVWYNGSEVLPSDTTTVILLNG
jgi:hypothetical protein